MCSKRKQPLRNRDQPVTVDIAMIHRTNKRTKPKKTYDKVSSQHNQYYHSTAVIVMSVEIEICFYFVDYAAKKRVNR